MKQKHAIVCLPADSIKDALRMKDLGIVNAENAKCQHSAYCQALLRMGFDLITMPADDRFPDSVFVEDPAIIIEDALILARLRCKERQGEEILLKNYLNPFFSRFFAIQDPGYVEGGDVVVMDNKLYIGLSKRTNIEGAEQLARIAYDNFGYLTDIIEIPGNSLHLKGDLSFHQSKIKNLERIVIVSEAIAHQINCDDRLVAVPSDERFSANGISVNGRILIHAGCPKTKKILEKIGFCTEEINLSEFAKIDGAMSCLSKLF